MKETPAWYVQARCRGVDTRVFYCDPEEVGQSGYASNRAVERAKEFCAECPVVLECLNYALDNEKFGVWGGMSERERKTLRRRRALNRSKGVL